MSASVSPANPPRPFLAGERIDSFAYTTLTKRLPVILTRIVDDVYRAYNGTVPESNLSEASVREAKEIIEVIAALKYGLCRDGQLRKVTDDGDPDVKAWNRCFETEFPEGSWFKVSWLFAECYMYRRVREAFACTTHWNTYDPFRRQKDQTFIDSHVATWALALRLPTLLENAASIDATVCRESFREALMISLWGNKVDLSLHATFDMEKFDHEEDLEASVISNDFDDVWERVITLDGGRVDIVLDNAGFELLGDLVLADWLIRSGKAKQVHFHAKAIPWFVSDTTPEDFSWTLKACIKGLSSFVDKTPPPNANETLRNFAKTWESYLTPDAANAESGTPAWVVTSSYFWSSAYAFWHLSDSIEGLSTPNVLSSDLIIFKGDLNYRKLVYDCQWEPTTPFADAIGPLATWGIPILALRTAKADVIVGLKEGQKEELDKKDSQWMVNGSVGLIQYCDGGLKKAQVVDK